MIGQNVSLDPNLIPHLQSCAASDRLPPATGPDPYN
jgi:hypothetical protein